MAVLQLVLVEHVLPVVQVVVLILILQGVVLVQEHALFKIANIQLPDQMSEQHVRTNFQDQVEAIKHMEYLMSQTPTGDIQDHTALKSSLIDAVIHLFLWHCKRD